MLTQARHAAGTAGAAEAGWEAWSRIDGDPVVVSESMNRLEELRSPTLGSS